VLVMLSSPSVPVEMVEAMCPVERAGDTSVLGCRRDCASCIESPPRRWVVVIGPGLVVW
jgi:hypothetical protein